VKFALPASGVSQYPQQIQEVRECAMSSAVLDKVRNEALDLPESDRAELAHDLVASLDGPSDPSAAQDWDSEISRRLSDIDSGTAKLIDRQEFSRRMRKRLSGS
jgi:putative addiction module component (TIGR02574 family)